MSEQPTRADLRVMRRLLSRWGAHYVWGMFALSEVASIPAAAIGLYYVLATVPLTPDQDRSVFAAVALFVSIANAVAVLYALRISRNIRAALRVRPDQRSEELEGEAWREVTSFPWRIALYVVVNTFVLVIAPAIAWALGPVGVEFAYFPYLLTGGLVATIWISVYYYFVVEWILWPVRQALLPRSLPAQRRYLSGVGIQTRMLVIYTALVFTALLMVVTIVHRKSQEAVAPGADPALVLQGLRGHLLFISLLALFLTVLFSIFLARSVGNPVRRLIELMAEVERGELGRRAELASTDETGHLTIAFNQMVSQLETLQVGLEEQVAQRTADLARRTAQLEAAARVARDAASIRNVQALLDQVVHLISDRFNFYHVGIFLVDEDGEYAVLRAASSEGGQRMLERGHRLKVGEVGIVGYVAGVGEPRIALDVGEDAVFFDNPDLPHTRSEMALPLKVGRRTIGVLDVQSEEPAAFTEEDVSVLQALADQLAVAIENARLLEQMERTVRELERFYGEYTREVWRAAGRRWRGLRYRQMAFEPLEEVPEETRRVLREGRSVVQPIRDGGDGRAAASLLTVPVRLRGQVIGALNVRFAVEEVPPEAVRLVEEVADRLALALESARLLEETQRRAARDRLLAEITARIRASMDPEAILRTAVRELGAALGVDRTLVQLRRETAGMPASDETTGSGNGGPPES
ncbi:MAG TPA: GAF domain-containing protein [Thermoflexia bacterium]|nr:GAF domain-containing protein [Thermoflexia bacterium]